MGLSLSRRGLTLRHLWNRKIYLGSKEKADTKRQPLNGSMFHLNMAPGEDNAGQPVK